LSSFNRWRRAVLGVVLLAAMTAAFFTTAAQAESVAPADRWTFSVTPYLWLPNINGTLKYSVPPGATGSPEVQVGPFDWLEALQFAMMITGEVRKGRGLMFTDLIYLDFSNEESAVKSINFGGNLVSSSANVSTHSTLRGGAWTLAGGYAVLTERPVALDVFGGLRYFGLEASTDWQLALAVTGPGGGQTFPRVGSVSQRMDLWDGIVGAKGRVWLGSSHWSIPYYLDLGTGSSLLTLQGMLGFAYSFKWGDVTLAYRYLYYDQNNDKLIQDMHFNGPTLGVTFRF
jgi:hypothetical protein